MNLTLFSIAIAFELVYMILTNSWMVWIIGTLGVILNVIAPFTEEPWLEERYGDRYLEYKRSVPRFVGKCIT